MYFSLGYNFMSSKAYLTVTIKVGLSPSKKDFICFYDSLSKMMINDFYFILKALFVLKIFKSCVFRHAEKTA